MADDLERLDRLIRETLPQLEAHGLNYGPFHYRYEGGREGDGESPRGRFPWGYVPGGHTPGAT